MTSHPLDNPLWASLSTLHRPIARGTGELLRYPADVAPFLATSAAALPSAALDALLDRDETVYLLGARPEVPRGWQLEDLGTILQMVCDERRAEPPGPPIVALTDRAPVVELAALVYPHYFRARTTELGRYLGILDDERLAAMIGERMGMPGFREISAVCTHPDHGGRGLARRLLARATNAILERGDVPFLHVSPHNTRAKHLYEQNGYRTRTAIAFWSLRAASTATEPAHSSA